MSKYSSGFGVEEADVLAVAGFSADCISLCIFLAFSSGLTVIVDVLPTSSFGDFCLFRGSNLCLILLSTILPSVVCDLRVSCSVSCWGPCSLLFLRGCWPLLLGVFIVFGLVECFTKLFVFSCNGKLSFS